MLTLAGPRNKTFSRLASQEAPDGCFGFCSPTLISAARWLSVAAETAAKPDSATIDFCPVCAAGSARLLEKPFFATIELGTVVLGSVLLKDDLLAG